MHDPGPVLPIPIGDPKDERGADRAPGDRAAEDLDAARQAMNGDADYQGMIAQAGADGLFVDGSVEEMVLVKMP